MRFIIFIFIVLCSASAFEALKAHDPGVCVVSRSVRKTRLKYYKVRSMCKGKRCIIKKSKVESYKVNQNESVCCTGWAYSAVLDACSPSCSMGCVGGRCVSPEVCQCDPPATLHPLHNNVCVTCEPACENSKCVNNTCICFEGYQKINNTCQPVCDSCVHGLCVAPNSCRCHPGYGGENCEPLCDNCDNGVCGEPNVCSCREGYLRNASGCHKPCPADCKSCDSQGQCQDGVCHGFMMKGRLLERCCDGWEYDNRMRRCKPSCLSGCGDGECVAPQRCECKPPLILDSSKKCVHPKPRCDLPCTNGACTADNVCTCDAGYTQKDTYTCVPKCGQSCINSVCVAPDTCQCLDGFESQGKWKCDPVCDDCKDGKCVAPNTCHCNSGYSKVNGKCVPVCEGECQNGFCAGPNKCECNLGYEIDPLDRFTCRPVCNPACVNASCVFPGTCSCYPGYESLTANICKPKCDDCLNGDCIGPNECRCQEGYELIGTKCKPVCSQICVNGYCSTPDTCSCNNGYELDARDKFTCNPICKEKCINGTCVSPDICQCFEGYEKTSNDNSCKPKCLSCENGICIRPDVCSCDDDYVLYNGTCVPVCSSLCINGYCKSPNECGCLDGYIRNSSNPAACYKPCSGLCNNGICNIDGNCICDPGYELHQNGSCVAITMVHCENCNGTCGDDGHCKCWDGITCSNITFIEPASVKSAEVLAGLQLTWLLGGCISFLLLVLVIVVMAQMWRKRQEFVTKSVDGVGGNQYGSVVYTVPDTLMKRNVSDEACSDNDEAEEVTAQDKLEAAERLLARYRETENNVCQPYCSKGCLNGICTSPENCTCNDGWYKEEEKCKPYCEFDCGGGTCVAPNSCVCNPNYIKAENLTCVPHCSQGCANGICVSPENCVCNKGWAKSNDLNVCLPHCEFECGGGICASPNVCECYAGYIMSANGTCIPHCPQGCPHGQCVQPGNCSCENGWYKNETHDECRPICDNNFINSVCVAPNTCECLSNYTKAENDSCVPYCSSGCPNGTCVNPEECECNDGWQNNENGICEPKCNSPCGNGKCIEPDVCECFPGYKFNIDNDVKYSNGLCIPECTGCNGTCIAPNNCVCDSPLQAVNVTEDGQKCDCIDFCFEGQNICRGTACVLNDTYVSTSDGLYDTMESTIISTITDEVRSDGMTTDNILEETSSSSFDSDTLSGSQGIYQIPYWAYFAIPSITIVLIVSSILICNRRAISQYCKGSSYVVEDDKTLHGSVSFNNVRSNPLKPEPELISGDI
ncbi:hypothetical protein KGM_210251 [Danaus plexippus plexippus]|uniref:EGF-like domain-containing protein n=1 Tax=Danaus plexippus plexippus TaxID=278856 RepID=A0A212EUY3_DANPL|nr:hypothetical protein KGM_210251 [Danaus plexippus plexippus]